MSKQISITDFLTQDEIALAVKLYNDPNRREQYATLVCDNIIRPQMERINAALGQKNDPKYLSYAVEFVMMQTQVRK